MWLQEAGLAEPLGKTGYKNTTEVYKGRCMYLSRKLALCHTSL